MRHQGCCVLVLRLNLIDLYPYISFAMQMLFPTTQISPAAQIVHQDSPPPNPKQPEKTQQEESHVVIQTKKKCNGFLDLNKT